MGYVLEAVVGPVAVIRPVTAALTLLPQGIAMVPMTAELFDADGQADQELGFRKLPAGYPGRLASWSAAGPVGYLEAEYFGGIGSQRAALWVDGQLTFGPVSIEEGEPIPEQGSPISRLLRELGVTCGSHQDEFEALDLGRHRDTGDWPTAADR